MEKVPPKHQPAQIKPEDIPGTEPQAQAEAPEEPAPEPEAEPEQPAEERFEQLEEEREQARTPYPVLPKAKTFFSRFSPLEIGMMGLGALVFIFALITVVNLIFA